MRRLEEGVKIPIKSFVDDIEETAIEEAKSIANLPFAESHIALMPEHHPPVLVCRWVVFWQLME